MSVVAQHCSSCVKSALFSELIMFMTVSWESFLRCKLSSLSSLWLSSYSISCCTHCNCNCWHSMTFWLWAVAASRSSIVLSEWSALICSLLSSMTSEVEVLTADSVNLLVKGSLWAWESVVSLIWCDWSVDVIASYASDVTVHLKVLSDQYVRGWSTSNIIIVWTECCRQYSHNELNIYAYMIIICFSSLFKTDHWGCRFLNLLVKSFHLMLRC